MLTCARKELAEVANVYLKPAASLLLLQDTQIDGGQLSLAVTVDQWRR